MYGSDLRPGTSSLPRVSIKVPPLKAYEAHWADHLPRARVAGRGPSVTPEQMHRFVVILATGESFGQAARLIGRRLSTIGNAYDKLPPELRPVERRRVKR